MKRYGLSLRRQTTISQHNRKNLIDKIVSYIINIWRIQKRHSFKAVNILAIDKTAVWADMVSNTTVNDKGAKTINMKSTGHDKVRVTVCLTAASNGNKLK